MMIFLWIILIGIYSLGFLYALFLLCVSKVSGDDFIGDRERWKDLILVEKIIAYIGLILFSLYFTFFWPIQFVAFVVEEMFGEDDPHWRRY